MSEYWGYHLIYNAYGCDLSAITDKDVIAGFSKTLVNAIKMEAYGEPQVVWFGKGDLEGYTLIQLIETSNIAAHFCNKGGEAYIDIFSCAEFDPEVAIAVIKDYFNPQSFNTLFVQRSAQKGMDISWGDNVEVTTGSK